MDNDVWTDVGAVDDLSQRPVQEVAIGRTKVALTCKDGVFGAISGVCNHAGGPLGKGTLDGDYVVCPWHYWKFHCQTGVGEPGFEADRVPAYEVRVEDGRVLVRNAAVSTRAKKPHPPHPLARPVRREAGPVRILGLSTTAMTADHPRYSTSEALLEHGLQAAGGENVRDPPHPPARPALPCVRGVLQQGRRAPAPGPARSRRWTRTISWTRSTRV